MSRSQPKKELKVFAAFAEVAKLRIIPNTIQKTDPPKPDISCELESEGPVAFELVEVIDSGLAADVGEQIRVQESLRRASRDSAGLESFHDALIFVRFQRNAGVVTRESSITSLFAFLRELPPGFAGDVNVPSAARLRRSVKALRVTRGDFPPGPHFQVEAGRWLKDPIVECLKNKFKKRYVTDNSIELLAYYDFHPSGLAEAHIPAVREYLKANIIGSPFTRVWVYTMDTKAVLYESPRTPNGPAECNRPLHLTAPGGFRARPSRAVLSLTRACRR